MAIDDAKTDVIERTHTVGVVAASILVLDGPDQGLVEVIRQGRLRVGTSPSNQLRLTDPTVSRMQCEFQLRKDGVRVVDTGSTNGTFIDSACVCDAVLNADTTLRVGNTTLRLELGDETLNLPISSRDRFGEVIGASLEMRRIYTLLERVAPTDSTVLLIGETGTGKEVVARSLHGASRRAERPFIAVDCGAVAENLIESELFGHSRGSFTGAFADREGLFEAADGGTLLLDEVGELPMELQPKLLRALETREIRRLGSNKSKRVDVRVIAATNRPLDQSVNDGSFREDLYYRLAVVEITLPSLRSRRADIPQLARHFWKELAGDLPVPEDLLLTLTRRMWRGNVRELRNYVERSISLGPSVSAHAGDRKPFPTSPELDALVSVDLRLPEARAAWMSRFESSYAHALLRKTGGNVTHAATLAGVNRRSFQRMLAKVASTDAPTVDGRQRNEPKE